MGNGLIKDLFNSSIEVTR